MIDTFQDIKALFDKHSITKHIEDLGLIVIIGNIFERSKASNL